MPLEAATSNNNQRIRNTERCLRRCLVWCMLRDLLVVWDRFTVLTERSFPRALDIMHPMISILGSHSKQTALLGSVGVWREPNVFLSQHEFFGWFFVQKEWSYRYLLKSLVLSQSTTKIRVEAMVSWPIRRRWTGQRRQLRKCRAVSG